MEVVFTARELDVMAVLWELGAATVAEVRERLSDDLAYTTVLTVLRTLEEKGYVGHEEVGKAYRYAPRVARKDAGQSALRRLTQKMFGGSAEALLTEFVADRHLSEVELKRLRGLLDQRLREDRDS